MASPLASNSPARYVSNSPVRCFSSRLQLDSSSPWRATASTTSSLLVENRRASLSSSVFSCQARSTPRIPQENHSRVPPLYLAALSKWM